jgi:hypothetical protein
VRPDAVDPKACYQDAPETLKDHPGAPLAQSRVGLPQRGERSKERNVGLVALESKAFAAAWASVREPVSAVARRLGASKQRVQSAALQFVAISAVWAALRPALSAQ